LALHGKFSSEKLMRMMEVIDLLDKADHGANNISPPPNESSTYGKILRLIQTSYATKEFSSADVARDFDDLHAGPIPLSTVSTYLARLADKGLLTRQKFGNSWVYRLVYTPSGQLRT